MAPQASKKYGLLPPDHPQIGCCRSNSINSCQIPGAFSALKISSLSRQASHKERGRLLAPFSSGAFFCDPEGKQVTKRLGLAPTTSQALGILWLVVAMFFMPTERWTSLPISDVFAADLQLGHPATEFRDWDGVDNHCVEAINSLEALDRRPRGPIPIPGPDPGPLVIGCNLADCGPGTDGPGPIDLRIALTGDLAENTILEFENMTVQEAARIGVRGNARHVKGTTRFEVRSGTTVLRGFRTNPELRPPVAIPHLNLNREALEAFKQAATVDDLLANSKSSVTLAIEQFRGRINVNGYALLDIFQHCLPLREPHHPPPPDPRDVVSVNFGTTAPLPSEITILAPGRVSPGDGVCNDYNNDVVRHTPTTSVANVAVTNHLADEDVTSGTTCHSEVVVYSCGSFDTTSNRCNSESRALAVVQPVNPPWTDPIGNKVPVELGNPLEVPVTVWILLAGDLKNKVTALTNEILGATINYATGMCGITFDDTPSVRFVNADIPIGREDDYLRFDPPVGESIMKAGCSMSGSGPCFYAAGSLNVYLVDELLGGAVGFTSFSRTYPACASGTISCDTSGDTIFLTERRAYDTLAHEFGHALELDATSGIYGFSNENLMWEYARGVNTRLTKGQCYRANVDHSSYVNTGGIRLGSPTHSNCPRDGAPSNVCPELSFDHP